jgi:hypothetical protein
MKLCPHCNASLEEDTVRCPQCGKGVLGGRGGKKKGKKRGSGKTRLLLLFGLLLVVWAVWKVPDTPFNPREVLDLKPNQLAVVQAIRSDLVRLVAAQDEYFRTHGEYSGTPQVLGFTPSEGILVSIIATPTGWSGAATHKESLEDVGCAVFEGSALPPHSPVSPVVPGVIECTTAREGP